MSRNRRRAFPTFLMFILMMLCLAVAGFVWSLEAVPRWAESEFGQADPQLAPLQRWLYSIQLLMQRDQLLEPLDRNGAEIPFRIEPGESVNAISLRLEGVGIIPNADVFRLYLVYSGLDRRLQAGSYLLSPAQRPLDIAAGILDATSREVDFVILAGWRSEEIAGALPTSGLEITGEVFLSRVQNPVNLDIPTVLGRPRKLEGYLLPGTYRLERKLNIENFLEAVLAEYARQLSPDLLKAIEAQGLTLHEAITLASIVEREAVVDEEQTLIASVFLNRLRIGMKLDSDPTVQYALGYQDGWKSWWKNPLSAADLQVDSPYNTYRYPGLPPGPICNPGLSALQAVAYPTETDYYYFRARCDGSGRHNFARNYEEHLMNACP